MRISSTLIFLKKIRVSSDSKGGKNVEPEVVDCLKGWMSRDGHTRYLKATLAKCACEI